MWLRLCRLAVLAGAESFVAIARCGTNKLDRLRRFRPCAEGTPSHDQLADIFATRRVIRRGNALGVYSPMFRTVRQV